MGRWPWLCGALLASLVGARTAGAAACAPGTLQGYIDLGATGCTAGAVLFADFRLESGQSFATPIDPTQVQVTPTSTANASALLLTFSSSAAAGELFESFFHFDASASGLVAAVVALAGASAAGDGVVTATQDVCPDGSFLPGVPIGCPSAAASSITFVSDSGSLLADGASFAGASFFDVFADVAADGGLSGSAALGSVTLSFTAIPEPSMAALLATGLVFFARSRVRRQG